MHLPETSDGTTAYRLTAMRSREPSAIGEPRLIHFSPPALRRHTGLIRRAAFSVTFLMPPPV